MSKIRLNKYLANLGLASRRKVDLLVEEGQVLVNGQLADLGMKIDPDQDEITVNGKQIKAQPPQLEYYLLNKPVDVVSSTLDPQARTTVIDLLKQQFPQAARVYPVGRLDANSEGLVLLTNDGDLAYRLTHPKHHVKKNYQVKTKGILNQAAIDQLKEGVDLEEGTTAPSEVKVLDINVGQEEMLLKITLHQGWKRQIRRMLESFGVRVLSLKRMAIGNLQLGGLKTGEVVKLDLKQIEQLK